MTMQLSAAAAANFKNGALSLSPNCLEKVTGFSAQSAVSIGPSNPFNTATGQ